MAKRLFATVFILLVFAAAAVSSPAPAKASKRAVADRGEVVTFVGCLRSADHGARFMLTDITGPNAPRARSWKTGFITRRSVSMTVTSGRSIKLRDSVGKLVRITGRRAGDDLHAESLAFAGAICR
ncbi:MAG: hypothetical protein HYU53_05345 [Acidobacteria bacterium]|nr:hypothetical protein [Acidobacteriota bacterium]